MTRSTLLRRVVLVTFLNVVVRSDNSSCQSGWKKFGCSCYFFAARDTFNWSSAREGCNGNFGSHLATISTKAENNFIGKHMKGNSWLGLRRKENKIELVGEGEAPFTIWDSINDRRSKLECIAARPTRRLTWVSRKCSKKLKYICEKPERQQKNGKCPKGWKKFKASCYLLSNSALSFDSARRKCQTFSAILAEVSTKEENEFVLSSLTTKNNEIVWFGLHKPINASAFRYLNSVPNYKAIGVVQPEIQSKVSLCATLSLGTNDAVWISRSCDIKYAYVCETAVNRGFNISTLDVNGTYAKVSWKVSQSSCDKLSSKIKYEFSIRVDNTTILNEEIPYGSATKSLHNLRPGTKYEVTITERFETSGSSRPFRFAFETTEIGLNIKTSDVNETYAIVSWRPDRIRCRKWLPKAKYKFSVKEGGKEIFCEDIPCDTASKNLRGLRPGTKYEVTITEIFGMKESHHIFQHSFETRVIKNPLKVMTNLSSFSIKANEGESVTMLCVAHGQYPITFIWEKDNKSVSSFSELLKPYPSSVLLVTLKDKKSFGKYICHIHDRFSKKSHAIDVEDFSAGDREKLLFVVTIILAVFILILILVIGYLFCQAHGKTAENKIQKPNLDLADAGEDETYENLHGNLAFTTRVSTPDVELSTYASLQRTNDETDKNYYCHLNKNTYKNS